MNEDQRKLADALDMACDVLEAADRFNLADAEAIAKTCAQVRAAFAEERAVGRLAYRTEELLTSLMMHERDDLEPAVKGVAFAELAEWRKARAALAELRGQAS
jgi:hypothetical protein